MTGCKVYVMKVVSSENNCIKKATKPIQEKSVIKADEKNTEIVERI